MMLQAYNICCYKDKYFNEIDTLNSEEDWNNLVKHKEQFHQALNNSIAYVALDDKDNVIGYIRAISDHIITLFICELLIKKSWRSNGIAQALITKVHEQYPSTRIELLATKSSASYYEKENFRLFYGYRRSSAE